MQGKQEVAIPMPRPTELMVMLPTADIQKSIIIVEGCEDKARVAAALRLIADGLEP